MFLSLENFILIAIGGGGKIQNGLENFILIELGEAEN